MLGSLVSVEHLDQVRKHVAEAKREKAVVAFEGKIGKNDGGAFMAPMIFDEVTPNMKIARQEIFGPVTAIMVSDSDNHALALANDTDYGLQASLFTRDIRRAYSFARQINAGTVSINAYSEGDITTPFGGFKQSGFGGRDKSIFAYDQYLEKKTIWIGLDS